MAPDPATAADAPPSLNMNFVSQRQFPSVAARLEANAPYAERQDERTSRLDNSIQNLRGRFEPRLFSRFIRLQLNDFVARAEGHSAEFRNMSDRRLRECAETLRSGLIRTPSDSQILARTFALVRETAHRNIGMRHYSSQLFGGAAMMRGAIAEMETGEGKTLTALLPAVAAALSGRPVHVVTVNDYLARRDAEQMRPVYEAMGLTVGLVVQGQEPSERRQAYDCDVAYCTNKDLVFDYLRDRLALGGRRAQRRRLVDELMQSDRMPQGRRLYLRGLYFAIVDEADSVLIDEARTPLILSGTGGAALHNDFYNTALGYAQNLVAGQHFEFSANHSMVGLTPEGETRLRELASELPGVWAIRRARNELVEQALSAIHLYCKDIHYIVADGKVQIVDEFTGRVMPDRSWERGLHQLIETKEGCDNTDQRQTIARITYQRFFRRYLHLCGMTGTALEAAGELRSVYGLNVIRIPTNRPLIRRDLGSAVLPDADAKWHLIVRKADELRRQGRAVLIGTRSIAASERVAALLQHANLNPVVLNARQDSEEAQIVAQAGQPGRITVATNMAGRGTDIHLDAAVRKAGGLHVILTEFHESARIDRQLFGRAGRQGDPGSFECIVSLGDELFSRFSDAYVALLSRINLANGKLSWAAYWLLRAWTQLAAERANAMTRRISFAEDERFQKSISFAGRAE
jgi:preprotein translocase subunit SecA